MAVYLAPEPIKELEDWFLATLRASFPENVFVIITHKAEEEYEAVPYDFIKIVYTGLINNSNTTYFEQQFGFRIVYSCHLPSTLLVHRRALALLEKGRLALWQKTPPRPADALPLLLKSEKLAKSSDCNCGPVYVQDWAVYNRVSNILVPNADPCQGANEPGSLIPAPIDYITPLNDEYYVAVNPGYNPALPITNGINQPYLFIDGAWVLNPDYDPNFETTWGNLPFILLPFVKKLSVTVKNSADQLLWYEDSV